MFHYVYKTTCLVTNRWYIGVHSTSNLFDGYLGSGLVLSRSINKYGKDNHSIVWLEFFDSREESLRKEAEIVSPEFLKTNAGICMNIKPGGSGGWANEANKLNYAKAGRDRQRWLRENDAEWAKRDRETRSKTVKNSFASNRRASCIEYLVNVNQPLAVKAAASDESRSKRKATFSAIAHQQGSKNSQFGTCWVSNDTHTLKIKLELLDEYISKGYIRGRKLIAS